MNLVRRSTIVTGTTMAATVLALAVAPPAGAVIAPKVTALSPTSGYTAGGNRITVSGSGFSHVSAVYFGTTKGSAITVLSVSKLTVVAPAHVDGRVDVRVKTTTAESPIVVADRYTYKVPPVRSVGVLGVTSASVALSWIDPVDPYRSQIVIRRSAAGSSTPPGLTTGTAVATLAKTATTATATGLVAGSTYAFSVFARDADGHYAPLAARVARTIAWGAPNPTDPSQGFPTAVSCTSTSFCALVDQFGTALSYFGSGWDSPQKLSLDHALTGVSCVSTTFCMAVGAGGFAASFDGTQSSAPVVQATGFTDDLNGVSCVSTSFCVAVDVTGRALTFDGAVWTATTVEAGNLTAISCVSTSFCVAVDSLGNAFTFGGSLWAGGTPISPGSFASLSCATTTMCVAIADLGKAWIFNGTDWTEHDTDNLSTAGPVSCASATFCLAADLFGNTEEWNGSAWASPHAVCDLSNCSLFVSGVSCPAANGCVLVEGNAGVFSTYSSGWTTPSEADDTILPAGLACPTSSFCALTDVLGKARLYNGVSWDSGTPIFASLGTISCPTATFCVAAAFTNVAVYNSGTWNPSTNVEGFSGALINDVSCSSPTFCAVVDSKGRVAFFNGTKWSALGTIDPDPLNAVSCSGPKLCAAADTAGRLLTFNGLTWSSPTYADTYNRVTRVSCVGTAFCAAVDDSGNALYFNGSSWSALSSIAGSSALLSLSCVSARFCYATTATKVVGFGPGLTAVSVVLPSHGYATGISCNATPMCTVVDIQGETIRGS